MKKIEAVVSPHELDGIRKAFLESGISKMIVSEIRDYGSHARHTEIYRSEEYSIDSKLTCKVETIIPQNLVTKVVDIISRNRRSGKGENRTILISTVNDVQR